MTQTEGFPCICRQGMGQVWVSFKQGKEAVARAFRYLQGAPAPLAWWWSRSIAHGTGGKPRAELQTRRASPIHHLPSSAPKGSLTAPEDFCSWSRKEGKKELRKVEQKGKGRGAGARLSADGRTGMWARIQARGAWGAWREGSGKALEGGDNWVFGMEMGSPVEGGG